MTLEISSLHLTTLPHFFPLLTTHGRSRNPPCTPHLCPRDLAWFGLQSCCLRSMKPNDESMIDSWSLSKQLAGNWDNSSSSDASGRCTESQQNWSNRKPFKPPVGWLWWGLHLFWPVCVFFLDSDGFRCNFGPASHFWFFLNFQWLSALVFVNSCLCTTACRALCPPAARGFLTDSKAKCVRVQILRGT